MNKKPSYDFEVIDENNTILGIISAVSKYDARKEALRIYKVTNFKIRKL